MKKQFFILCTSLLLSSSLSFASTAKIELDSNDKENQITQKIVRPFKKSNLENLFKERLEQAVHTQKTSGNHLSFLFNNKAQEKSYRFHRKSLETLTKEGFFENFYSLWTQQKLFAENVSETLDMQDLSSLQEVVKENRHRILLHQKTGLILRLKPAEEQFSFSFYTAEDGNHEKLVSGNAIKLNELFSSLKCGAEAFKLYLYKTSNNNVLAIPVPRDPISAISLKKFVGKENFENIPSHMVGNLSAYFKRELIGTLGHIAYHALPTYMTIESSTHIGDIDFSSNVDFPSLGGETVEAKVTPKNSDSNTFETTTSTSSQDDFDFHFSDEEDTLTFGTTSPEHSSSNDESTKTTTRSYNGFDFCEEEDTLTFGTTSPEHSSSNSQSMGYNHPVMYPHVYPVPVIVGYDTYGYPIMHYVIPYSYPPYHTSMAYNSNFHG